MKEVILSDNQETHEEVKHKNNDDIIISTDIPQQECKINNFYFNIYYYFVSFAAHENYVKTITTNDGIVNTPNAQIQEQKNSKNYNNVSAIIR